MVERKFQVIDTKKLHNEARKQVSDVVERGLDLEPEQQKETALNLYNQALKQADAKNLIIAREIMEASLKLNPESYDAHMGMADILESYSLVLGKSYEDERKGHLSEALRINPKGKELQYSKALDLLKEGKYEKGLFYLQELSEIYPKDYIINFQTGSTLIQLKRFDTSIVYFEKVMDSLFEGYEATHQCKDPKFAKIAYQNYGIALYEVANEKNDEEMREIAKEAFIRALEWGNDSSDVHMFLAWILDDQFNYEKALEHYLRAHESDPEDFGTKLRIGELYLDLGKYDEAEKYAEEACKYAMEQEEVVEAYELHQEVLVEKNRKNLHELTVKE